MRIEHVWVWGFAGVKVIAALPSNSFPIDRSKAVPRMQVLFLFVRRWLPSFQI